MPGDRLLRAAPPGAAQQKDFAITRAIAGLHGRLTILIIGHRGALGALADHRVRIEAGRIATNSDMPLT